MPLEYNESNVWKRITILGVKCIYLLFGMTLKVVWHIKRKYLPIRNQNIIYIIINYF